MKDLMPFLETLAAKIGTTIDMLWSALVKQAAINGCIDIITDTVFIVLSVILIKFVSKKTKKPKDTEEYGAFNKPKAEWNEEGAVLAWIFLSLYLIFVSIFVCLSIGDIITSFFNPEYWALKQIIH